MDHEVGRVLGKAAITCTRDACVIISVKNRLTKKWLGLLHVRVSYALTQGFPFRFAQSEFCYG